ncbi:MAG: rhomboid family intramembrane serine protease [Candidatus Aenigmarchaeota archaeon]|nr:rhomboid family intramembrane serine protease [Candidatus Aenigmarchaeota archaeon]
MKLTLFLVIVNVAVFAYASQNLDYFIENYGFSAKSFWEGRYETLITSIFMHADIPHIGWNMATLFLVGIVLEKYIGRFAYLLVYLISGIAANLGVLLLAMVDINILAIGASAAISGLIGYGAFRLSGKWMVSISFIPIPMPFIIAGALYTLMNFYGLFILNTTFSAAAHIIGGVTGGVLGLSGERNKLGKIMLFILAIVIISLLPYLIGALL